jgi:hypothetical protein
MKVVTWCPCLLLLAPIPVAAQAPPSPPADKVAAADLARLIHKAVVAKMPRVYEDKSGWGHTVPLPDRLRFPRLRRTVVEVGDHMEVPDSPWRKVRVRLDDPDRDLQVRVRSFRRLDAMTYRVVVETDAALRTEADVQRWRNGLLLADLTGRADVALGVVVECDVAARLDAGKLPPALKLVPEIRELKLNLNGFTPKEVTFRRAGLKVEGEAVEAAGEEFKGALQALLRQAEPAVKKRAGEALERGLKEGKEPLTAAAVLKAVAPLLKAEDRAREK